VVVPWVLYRQFGDTEVLQRQFASMRGWVDRMRELAGDDLLWVGGFQYGDWLDPTAPPQDPAKAMTPHDVVATAHLAYSAELVARAAAVIGRGADAERYAALAEATRAAFRRAYVTSEALVLGDSQTAYSMAIEWSLIDDEADRQKAGDRLADRVRRTGFTIGTGFVGTPLILDALTDTGHLDAAYRLVTQTENPSWLYPITMGATTIWERWDSMLEDGTINPGQMTSFNHYAYGVVVDWMHRVIGGLDFADPGRRTLVVHPRPGAGITSATTRQTTPYGEAAVEWSIGDGRMRLKVTVPTGSRALVSVPGETDTVEVGAGVHEWAVAAPAGERRVLGANPTTREVIDDEQTWLQVVAAAKQIDPSWSGKTLADGAGQYLDLDIHEITRLMGRSIIYPEEGVFSDAIDSILGS
jgi:alpha-L-rhamnosidase